ncbi:MAG: phage portal protein [Stappia sp.]|uniref:phage portal protein n=1 Tax=Stappia sp. TaxID=1870903 RepID=UPI000C5CE361|nr:phage portal protein [Stappia sp.]MAA98680.1 phage portal protein [Stappia sp.]MBM20490.1 phage portal protein [Stappia sp.]
MKIWPFKRKPPVEAKSLASPEEWLREIFGISPPGSTALSASQALRVPAVQSAVRVISEAVASLDIKIMRIEAGGGEAEDRDHPAARLLQDEANAWTTSFELIRDLVSMALTSDAGGLAWVNRLNGEPREIIRYEPGAITVEYSDQRTNEPAYTLNNRRLDPGDVIHLRGPFTQCPLTLARDAIAVLSVMETHAARLFSTGARPGGVIETDKNVGDEGVKRMLAGWRAAQEGAANAGKTAILWDGAKWRQMTLNSVDAQFLELRKFQILEVARAFRVPPSMLFELDRATWSNSEQMGKEFLTYTLEPWLRALEGALRRALFTPEERPAYRVWFERDDLTRADLGTRATAYSSLIAARVLNPNEARGWEGLEPYAGGDEFANPNTGASQPGAAAPQEPMNGPE